MNAPYPSFRRGLMQVALASCFSAGFSPRAWAGYFAAPGPVTGVLEVDLVPDRQTPISPLFTPIPKVGGRVQGAASGDALTADFRGETAGLANSWWQAAPAGPVLYPVSSAAPWQLAAAPNLNALGNAALDTAFPVGAAIRAVPFWKLVDLAGDPATLGPYAHTDPTLADVLFYQGEMRAAFDNGSDRFWTDPAAPGATFNQSRLASAVAPLFYHRARASSQIRLVVQGTARTLGVPFQVDPGQEQMLLRPDGLDFFLTTNSATANSSVFRLGMTPGTGEADADVAGIWNETLQAWERFYFDKATKTLRSNLRPLPSSLWTQIRVPAGASFTYRRSATALTPMKVTFPGATNAPLAVGAILPIVDLDKDLIADGWERTYGGTSMTAAGDEDMDGLTNFQEYLLGGDPTVFDAPAQPTVNIVPASGLTPRQAWVSFYAKKDHRYLLQTRRANETIWRVLGTGIYAGANATVTAADTSYSQVLDRVARFYRVVGLAPTDTDGDLLSDWEETEIYHTRPDLADTDGDGVSDSVEAKLPLTRNPLEFYDGRLVTVTPVMASQYAPAGEWMREALAVKVTSGSSVLKNAPVDFVFAAGSGYLSDRPGGDVVQRTRLTVKADATGIAQAWLWVPRSSVNAIQVVAAARVPKNGQFSLSTTNLAVLPTSTVSIPTTDLVAWYRADQNLHFADATGDLSIWESPVTGVNALVTSTKAPRTLAENRRGWLAFTGIERLSLGSSIADDSFSVYFAAAGRADRTSTSASTSKALSAGSTGQRYLFGTDVPTDGANIISYSAPSKPGAVTFSLWEHVDAFPTDRFPGFDRPYVFTPASGRIDNTRGYRITPSPTGNHSRRAVSDVVDSILSSNTSLKNWTTSYRKVDTKSFVYLGKVAIREDFYEITASSWRGNADSSSFGGVAVIDTSRVGTVAAALSVGKNNLGAFELRNGWTPTLSGAAGGANSTGFVAAWRVQGLRQDIEAAGISKTIGLGSPASRLVGPSLIGGTNATTQGYVGNVGDVLFFRKSLLTSDHQAVNDYLGTVYRGQIITDTDGDKLPDWWEQAAIGNHDASGKGDTDLDGLTNAQEYTLGTNPLATDTDGDGLADKDEVAAKTKAASFDTDGDLIPDKQDLQPTKATNGQAETDHNGLTDAEDFIIANPSLFADLNANGIPDVLELFH